MVDQLLTVPQAAERLGISRIEAYQLVKAGEIPAKRLSPRRIRISELALQQWIDSKEDVATVAYSSTP